MISVIDGGISSPKVPAPASVPTIIRSGYSRLRSSGIDILPIVATVAAEDPEIAAKIAEPAMFTCKRPPGRRCIQGVRPRNRFSDNRVRNRISPIQMNSGRAVNDHDELALQIVVAMASPTGRAVNSSMPIAATPVRLIATQIPVPRKKNRIARKVIVKAISLIPFRPRPAVRRAAEWSARSCARRRSPGRPHRRRSPTAGSKARWHRRPR